MQEINRHQRVVLDRTGTILESCDTLFPTKGKSPKSLGDFILFTKNIIPYIENTLHTQNAVTFKGIHTPAVMLPGSYDFVFSAQEKTNLQTATIIECCIIERTDFYQNIRKDWQKTEQEAL